MNIILFGNLLDEINGHGPRVQPNDKPYLTTANAIRTSAQQDAHSFTIFEKFPTSAVPEERVTKSTADRVKEFEETLAKAPKRKITDPADASPSIYAEEDAEPDNPSRPAVKAPKTAGRRAAPKMNTRNGSMWVEPGKTLDQNLTEFEEKNADGDTFDDLVYAAFLGESTAADAGIESKKPSRDEFEVTTDTDIDKLAKKHAAAAPAEEQVVQLKKPGTKKVKTNAGKAVIPRAASSKVNGEAEYSDEETEPPVGKAPVKVVRLAAKNPVAPKANKKLAKIVSGTVK
ncbi:hypothetical protein BU23DRAFT_641592 [Bimuria novae-zelandiae CBS 107.79]|uniref:Uncharacterized protein n=1 Tax=Bimuria novae-zelandiae CBS 107.79 TaxID=1447943 RepID=A0A6A5V7N4_9PLEO|nr:hypothetical protein BU23DRAFT_641592 [Bimuria novae-zelandiae CBS 107.79]